MTDLVEITETAPGSYEVTFRINKDLSFRKPIIVPVDVVVPRENVFDAIKFLSRVFTISLHDYLLKNNLDSVPFDVRGYSYLVEK